MAVSRSHRTGREWPTPPNKKIRCRHHGPVLFIGAAPTHRKPRHRPAHQLPHLPQGLRGAPCLFSWRTLRVRPLWGAPVCSGGPRVCGCETGCAGYPPLDLGSEKAPPDEAHTGSRFSLDLYSRACAPGNVFWDGHGHIREALTTPLGPSPSSGRARSSSHLQTAVLAHGLTTQRRGGNSARRDIW